MVARVFVSCISCKDFMEKYAIQPCEQSDCELIVNKLIDFNMSQVAPHVKGQYLSLSRKVIDDAGNTIAGILCNLNAWNYLQVDILWVDKAHRKSGLGSKLLAEVEAHAKSLGCYLIHLDTFDFQAKDFYIKQGYDVFGTLDDCPMNHQRFYLRKRL